MGKARKKNSEAKRKNIPAGKRSDFQKVLEQGEKLYLEGNLLDARTCFTKLLEVEPDHAEILNNLGVIAFQENLLDEALSFFQKALSKEPGFYDAVENTAKVLEAKGEYLEALKRFRNALEIGGLRTETLNSMARCFLELDDRKSAGEVLRESLTLNPDQADVRKALEDLGITADIPENKIRKPAKKLNIGFVSIWFERGQSYVTKTIRDALAKEHDTFVFARTGGVYGKPMLDTSGVWNVPRLTTYPEYTIPAGVIQKWIQENRLDAVIFNEEYDWDLVRAARETGVKILTYLDYYKDDWKPFMSLYDAVLCSTKRTYELVKGFCRAYYMGWAVDTELFHPVDDDGSRHTFFHNAGWLGINYRKMTPAAIVAFDAISRHLHDVTLFVHSQAELGMLPPEIVKIIQENHRITYHVETLSAPGLYHKGRILLFPTKLEGLGLPLFEALASGLPVIATDAPPMNEFIQHGVNGLLVRVAHRAVRNDDIAFPEELLDINDLALKMAALAQNAEAVRTLSLNARQYAERELSVVKLRTKIIECIEGLFDKETPKSSMIFQAGHVNASSVQTVSGSIVVTTHFSPEAELTIRELCKARNDISGFIIQRPTLQADPAYEKRKEVFRGFLCQSGIDARWYETANINEAESEARLKEWSPDILVTIGGRILKKDILAVPKRGVINLHTSVLPKYRNLGSEFWALYYNDLEHIGHTVHVVDRGIDSGPILLQKAIGATGAESELQLRKNNMLSGADSLLEVLSNYDRSEPTATPQTDKKSLFFAMPDETDRQRGQFRFQHRRTSGNAKDGKAKQSLLTGLSELTYGWKQILEQEGLPFEVSQINEGLTPERYATLIINRDLTKKETEFVRRYLREGGAVLTDLSREGSFNGQIPWKHQFIEELSLKNGRYDERILLRREGFVIKELENQKGNNGHPVAVNRQIGKGHVTFLPFDPEEAVLDGRADRMPSPPLNGKHDTERIAVVSKGGVRRFVVDALHRLYAARHLPYAHLWYYPGNFQSAFAFRIDSDGYEATSFNNTYLPAEKHGIRMSWYIDVGAQFHHMDDALRIARAGQDVQVHCLRHETFDDYESNVKNIATAVQVMKKAGLSPVGFVAPYGKWNTALNRALETIGICYSSEFSMAWDDLPFYPIVDGKRPSKVLQVPIHPFCLGSMMKSGFTLEEVLRHYDRELDRKYCQGEPIFFYCHPIERLGKYPQVLDHIFSEAKKRDGIWFTDLTQFHIWWKLREKSLILPELNGRDLTIHSFTPLQDAPVRIVMPDGSRKIVSIHDTWQSALP